jgi:signal recognition particle receptor subunit beta
MTDKERLIEAIDELREELNNVEENLRPDQALPLLIFANKTDLPTAMPLQDITNNEEFKSIVKNRNWHIQPSSIAIGTGLYEGIDWFERQVEARRTGAIVACDLKS